MEKEYKRNYIQYKLTGQQKYKDLYEKAYESLQDTNTTSIEEPIEHFYMTQPPPSSQPTSWVRVGILGILGLIVWVL